MIQKLRKNRKGFTLIELIVVIAILGILAAILIPQFAGFQDRAKSAQALVDAKQVATAIDALAVEGGYSGKSAGYPAGALETDASIIAVRGMSKVLAATEALVLEADGGFTVTMVDGGFKAGRATDLDKVAIIP